ncbi:MAG: hypothetical protein ACI9V8_000132 [Urechidicola sp.]
MQWVTCFSCQFGNGFFRGQFKGRDFLPFLVVLKNSAAALVQLSISMICLCAGSVLDALDLFAAHLPQTGSQYSSIQNIVFSDNNEYTATALLMSP